MMFIYYAPKYKQIYPIDKTIDKIKYSPVTTFQIFKLNHYINIIILKSIIQPSNLIHDLNSST